MKRMTLAATAVALITLTSPLMPLASAAASPAQAPTRIQWQKWSDDVFDRAKREHKFVLLDLEAIWCHWCHVMDQVTYSDPQVIRLINQRYIAVKVDQDSRPDISNKYEDYGWPATVVFNADGGEIVIRQGYVPPMPMARMLKAVIDDPTPGPSVRPQQRIAFGRESSLPPALRAQMQQRFDANYDPKQGGWGTVHKYVDWDAIELSMNQGRAGGGGDQAAAQRARQTLTSALRLIDPAWGGVYQYSTDADWVHPHFEKIMQFQAEAMRIYALAYAQYHDPAYLKAAQDIRRYLANFLTSPDGAFYTSQNADLVDGQHSAAYFAMDDAARRRQGIPRIDTHSYARENGWAIYALCALYEVTGDRQELDHAIRAAQWVISHRAIEGAGEGAGGFRHDEHDAGGPYLADTLGMGRAFLSLYAATADRIWLDRASAAATYIGSHFTNSAGTPGFVTAASHGALKPAVELDENVTAARFFNLLGRYTGNPAQQELARRAMRYVAAPQVSGSRGPWVGGILLADSELSNEPLHVTVVGSKQDPAATALFHEAIQSPVAYKRVEWWDPSQGTLPNPDVQYPPTKIASAFLCTANTCSPPIPKLEALRVRLHRLAGN